MAARASRLVAGAVLLVGFAAAGALFTFGGDGRSTPPGLAGVALELEGRLREAGAGLHARAMTLAELPRMSAAVATDVPTVHNLTQDELAFRPQPGEIIEIGQVRLDGHVVSLLRIPEGSSQVAELEHAGVAVTRGEHGVMISEVVDIKPDSQKEIDHGALAVSWTLDTKDAEAKMEALGVPARFEVGGRTVLSTKRAFVPGAPTVRARIDVSGGAVVAESEPAAVTPLRAASAGVAALALLVAGLLWRRGSRGAEPVNNELVDLPPKPASDPAAEKPASQPGSRLPSTKPDSNPQDDLGHAPTSQLPPSDPLLPKAARDPATFGRYTVVRKLGSGGMAEVYLALAAGEAGFTKPVALKIMHHHLAQMPQIVEHFLDEARIASRLSHPNIVPIIDLGKAGEDYFIAMEFVDGSDLGDLMSGVREKGELVPIAVGLAILRKVCRGLHAAHTALGSDGKPLDLVHRDVKAENVMVSRQGDVKVSDFGIAKANQKQAQTRAGQVKGTTAYMAPEQRMGQAVDRRADVYGVGALAYELLAGTEINLDFEMLAHRGVEGWPHLAPASRLRPELPLELDTLIFKALAFNREDRFASCEEMEEALDAVAARHQLLAGDKQLVAWMEHMLA